MIYTINCVYAEYEPQHTAYNTFLNSRDSALCMNMNNGIPSQKNITTGILFFLCIFHAAIENNSEQNALWKF